jgi:hypothetical protein
MELVQLMMWGNSFDDYCHIFDLKNDSLPRSILDCSNVPSSFNAEVIQHNTLNIKVVSCSQAYRDTFDALSKHSTQMLEKIDTSIKNHASKIEWKQYPSKDNFKNSRTVSVETFLKDYKSGLSQRRYIPVSSLTKLPFKDNEFDMVLCCASLFNTDESTLESCLEIIKELCRVANEARIYPLLDNHGNNSTLLGPVALALQASNYGLEIRHVNYDFIRGGNAMLRTWSQACQVSQ